MAPFAQVTHAVEQVPAELLWIPIALLAARLFGVVERWGQPAVLGELLAGILLGNLALIGFPFLEPISCAPLAPHEPDASRRPTPN